jgi:hypothetical protein
MPNLQRVAFRDESRGSLHLDASTSSIVVQSWRRTTIENSNIRLGRVYSLRKTGRVGKNRHYFHGRSVTEDVYRVALDLSTVKRNEILRLFRYPLTMTIDRVNIYLYSSERH